MQDISRHQKLVHACSETRFLFFQLNPNRRWLQLFNQYFSLPTPRMVKILIFRHKLTRRKRKLGHFNSCTKCIRRFTSTQTREQLKLLRKWRSRWFNFKTHADAENVLNFLGNKFQLIQTTVKLICSCELLEKINLFHHEIECASWIIRIIAFHDYRMFWRWRGCRAVGASKHRQRNVYGQAWDPNNAMANGSGMRKKK